MRINYPITWFYYSDLDAVMPFYQETLGLRLWLDQGWAKIFEIGPNAYVGLVDEAKGSVKASEDKPVLLTFVVDDVDEWHQDLEQAGVDNLTTPTLHEDIGVYCFFLEDPAGYMIEIQKFVD